MTQADEGSHPNTLSKESFIGEDGKPVAELRFLIVENGKSITLRFSKTVTISFVKNKLIEQWPREIPGLEPVRNADAIKLIYAGKVLENGRTLEEYNIKENERSTLHLVIRPPASNIQPESDDVANKAAKCSCTIL
mmetsp:Transcript_35574/g.57537  ORF Transcript_35574/g.57537 Transcript_35574/m.57537 type:complete len:136 (+) Transcript_35574:178-585(+)